MLPKSGLPILAIWAFLCLFGFQLQALITFEGIDIFLIFKKGN